MIYLFIIIIRICILVLRTLVGRLLSIPTKSQKYSNLQIYAINQWMMGSTKISFCDLNILSLISFTKEIQTISTKKKSKQTLSQLIVS